MDNLENFWSAVDGHPSLTHHIRSKPGYKRTLVPLGLHGDGVPLTGRGKVWQQGFTNFSFFSLVGQGNTGELLFYIWGLFEKLKYLEHEANSTLTRAFAILRWSFQALFEGVWPSRNHLGELFPANSQAGKKAGQRLAGPYSAVFFALLGDLDFYAGTMGLPRSSLASGPCWLCRCQKWGAQSWQNFRRDAPWIQTMWSAQAWKNWAGKSPCELFRLDWFSALNIAPDYMHNKYLGGDQFFYASILYLLTHHLLHSDEHQNMLQVWKEIQEVYRSEEIPCRYRYLNTVRMFLRRNNTLKLKGKASEIRFLHLPLLRVWEAHMVPGVQVHRKIHLALKLNALLEGLLIDFKGFVALPPQAAQQFEEAMSAFLLLVSELKAHFEDDDNDIRLFTTTEKHHFLQHTAKFSATINPRMLWAFAGEDQQRRAQTLAHAGTWTIKSVHQDRPSVQACPPPAFQVAQAVRKNLSQKAFEP
ncbi:unnamed protein product [Symbiodinium sp. CCMP2456]|nr:unnamed protein product [Symbiodinium sp. CCMP2456]